MRFDYVSRVRPVQAGTDLVWPGWAGLAQGARGACWRGWGPQDQEQEPEQEPEPAQESLLEEQELTPPSS